MGQGTNGKSKTIQKQYGTHGKPVEITEERILNAISGISEKLDGKIVGVFADTVKNPKRLRTIRNMQENLLFP